MIFNSPCKLKDNQTKDVWMHLVKVFQPIWIISLQFIESLMMRSRYQVMILSMVLSFKKQLRCKITIIAKWSVKNSFIVMELFNWCNQLLHVIRNMTIWYLVMIKFQFHSVATAFKMKITAYFQSWFLA